MKDKRGAALLLFLAVIWLAVMISGGLMVLGRSLARSIRTQNALDAAAVSGANVLAERARVISDINRAIRETYQQMQAAAAAQDAQAFQKAAERLKKLDVAARAVSQGTSQAIEREIRRVASLNGLEDVQISNPHTIFQRDGLFWTLRDAGPIELRLRSHRSSSWIDSRRGGLEARDWYGRLFARSDR